MSNSSFASETLQGNKIYIRKNVANGGLLAAYFVIRLIVSSFHLTQSAIPSPFVVASTMLMFFIIGGLLLFNIRNLSAYNIDHASVVIIFLFSTLLRSRKIDTNNSLVLEVLFLLLAVLLFIFFINRKPKLERRNIFNKWFFIAIFTGWLYANAKAYLDPINHEFSGTIRLSSALAFFAHGVFFEIGTAGLLEEPIYRGFLFGFLRDLGLKPYQVILIQGLFFWVSHYNLILRPFTFWFFLPVMCLLLGFLAYKSRSIIPPMITHVFYNAYQDMLLQF